MQRKRISTYSWTGIVWIIIPVIVMIIFSSQIVRNDNLRHALGDALIINSWERILILVCLANGFITWAYWAILFYKAVDPVYYDTESIYWSDKGVEHSVPLASIEKGSLHAMQQAQICTLRYSNENEKKTINFILIDRQYGALNQLAEDLEKLIRAHRPEFTISKPWSWRIFGG